MAYDDYFSEIQIPQQKTVGGVVFPAVVLANKPAVELGLLQFTEAVRAHRPRLEALLQSSGAVLLRGFPVQNAASFDRAVEAFGYEEFPYVGGAALRSKVVGRVYTANESPPEQLIPFHPEMSHVPEPPSKLFFFCEEEPKSGGETPIVLSNCAYERVKKRFPEFVEKLEEHGLLYTRILGEEDDPSCPVGRGWQSTFLTTDKKVAEERAAGLGMKLEWLEDGVKVIIGPMPAIKLDKIRGQNIWFNGMIASYIGLKDVRNNSSNAVTFGDGTPLPSAIIYECLKILEEDCVAIPWKKGDILLVDNFAVLHSRRSFEPPRRILASFCK